MRITEVLADEGSRVKKGDVLARLVADTLDAQLAQNDAGLARSAAAIAQAKAPITQAEARLVESRNALERAKPLRQAGHMTEAVFDQREQAARTADAQLAAAKDGLNLALAEKAQVEAQRRELMWRRGRVEVTAPADGIVSRRMARVGGYAAGAAEPMFRIVAKAEVELDAEVTETRLASIAIGQIARVEVAGLGTVSGTVRLVSPEVDKATRLGRVRIFLGDNPGLRVGAFARGTIVTANGKGLAVPASAVLYGPDGPSVQVVRAGRVETRRIKTGLAAGALVEVREGLGRRRPGRRARRHVPARGRCRAAGGGRRHQAERGGAMNWNISAWSIRQPVPSLVLFLVLMTLGFVSFGELPVTRFPNIDVPIVQVRVYQAGAAPSELRGAGHQEDRGRDRRRERRQAPDLGDHRGLSRVTTIEFRLETNQDRAVNDVKDAIARIRSELPRTIEEPIVTAHRGRRAADRHLRGARRRA